MKFQVGKGPWASEVSGIVKIGQTMTMVLGIKGSELARLNDMWAIIWALGCVNSQSDISGY